MTKEDVRRSGPGAGPAIPTGDSTLYLGDERLQ